MAVQKQDTETGISDYTAFPSALRDEYFMRDRRRLGAPLNMCLSFVSPGDGSLKRKRSWFEKWGLLEKHSRRRAA